MAALALPSQAPNKSPEAFRTISEVALLLDVPQHVLRFWESRFVQIRPVKWAGGRRYYRPEDVDLLKGIHGLLYTDGVTIRGVQKILKERGLRHVAEIGRGEASTPPLVIEKLVFVEKPKTVAKPRHLRAVPSPMTLPFYDEPVAQEPPQEPPSDRLAIEERARLLALLAELETLKRRLHKARQLAA